MIPGAEYLLVVFTILALTAGQLLFKAVSMKSAGLLDMIATPGTLGLLLLALAVYGVATLAWITALRSLPLSKAYMFIALGFVLVPIAAHFVFGEALTWRVMAGAVLVMVGVYLAAG